MYRDGHDILDAAVLRLSTDYRGLHKDLFTGLDNSLISLRC